jgi:hypothetical protein
VFRRPLIPPVPSGPESLLLPGKSTVQAKVPPNFIFINETHRYRMHDLNFWGSKKRPDKSHKDKGTSLWAAAEKHLISHICTSVGIDARLDSIKM